LRIGFDLDGTLCDISVALLRSIDNMKDKQAMRNIEQWYYRERKPIFNARLFLHETDEMYIITSRPKRLNKITRKWVNKYYPKAKLYICDYPQPLGIKTDSELNKWLYNKQKDKAEVLNKLKLDVYFDDDPSCTDLRDLCPTIKIIQFGGRI